MRDLGNNKATYFYHYPKPPKKKANEWGEYSVEAYDNMGKKLPGKNYNAGDYEDALATFKNYLSGKRYDRKDKEIK